METVEKILHNAKCAQYVSVMEKNGYDSGEQLLSMNSDDFEHMAQVCKILPGHLHRLKKYIAVITARAHPAEFFPTRPMVRAVPASQNDAAAAAVAASASTRPADSGPDVSVAGPREKNQKFCVRPCP